MDIPSTALIDVAAAGVELEGRTVLDDITLVTDARRIAVVGRNGSGKTTLARLLAGLVPAQSGTVRIAGVDVAQDRRAALRTVGILFQNPDHQIIFPTVVEELGFGLRQMGMATSEVARAVDRILQRFGRGHWRDAPIHTLSHGQKQLVCLMAILVMEPRVILLDEPFAGLDIPTSMQLARILAQLDTALIQITHDPRDVDSYEYAVWIDGGRIAQAGPARQVLRSYRDAMAERGASDDLADLAG